MPNFVGDIIEFGVHYQDSDGVSIGPLTVTASVYEPGHTLVSSGSATFMAKGVHYFQYTPTVKGLYYCVFETSDADAVAKDLATLIHVKVRSIWGPIGDGCV